MTMIDLKNILQKANFVPAERKLVNILYYTIPSLEKLELVYYNGTTKIYICRGLCIKNNSIQVDDKLFTKNTMFFKDSYEQVSIDNIEKINELLINLKKQYKLLSVELKKNQINKDFYE